MPPTDPGSPPPEPPPGRPVLPPPDIVVVPPRGGVPLSRGARERKLDRTDRYDRRAELTAYEALTPTGTVRLSFEVVDGHPFEFLPGYFVGIQAEIPGLGFRRSPYCLASPPDGDPRFDLVVRLVPEGPLSCYLAGLSVGDTICFRGPSGRSMLPRDPALELVLMATGVGVGPFLSLVDFLLLNGSRPRVRFYWGLRQVEDICLLDRLDDLRARHAGFGYAISLSEPPEGWTGMRGRVTETVPPLLETLGDKQFYLVGNGAMVEEMHAALSDQGVDEVLIYKECYFNVRHRPDPRVMAEIRRRFVASDTFNPHAHQEAGLFIPERTRSKWRGRTTSSQG